MHNSFFSFLHRLPNTASDYHTITYTKATGENYYLYFFDLCLNFHVFYISDISDKISLCRLLDCFQQMHKHSQPVHYVVSSIVPAWTTVVIVLWSFFSFFFRFYYHQRFPVSPQWVTYRDNRESRWKQSSTLEFVDGSLELGIWSCCRSASKRFPAVICPTDGSSILLSPEVYFSIIAAVVFRRLARCKCGIYVAGYHRIRPALL